MSWKSLVSAGLLCILASPVLAVPQLNVTNGGLDANGNWIWNVSITPTAAGTPLAAELGFRETTTGSQISGAVKGPKFTGANTDNPGTRIFTWETLSDTDGDGMVETNGDDEPVGVQVNNATDEVFAALGTIDDLPAGGATQFLTITSAGPTDTRPGTVLQVLGAYSGNGRIAEITTGTTAVNYSNFAGTATRTLVPGDANLSGVGTAGQAAVTLADLTILATNLNKATGGPYHWGQGDFNGTVGGTEVTLADLTILATNLNKTNLNGVSTPLQVNGVAGGAGAGAALGGSAVPEPATMALVGLAVLGGLGLLKRNR